MGWFTNVTLVAKDELGARHCALLSHNRSARARAGLPVFRWPVLSRWHMAVARKLFKPEEDCLRLTDAVRCGPARTKDAFDPRQKDRAGRTKTPLELRLGKLAQLEAKHHKAHGGAVLAVASSRNGECDGLTIPAYELLAAAEAARVFSHRDVERGEMPGTIASSCDEGERERASRSG